MKRLLFTLPLLLLTACPGKKDDATSTSASATASGSAPLVASASAAPPVSASASASGSATAVAAGWSGTYTLTAGTISIPSDNPDYKGVKQAKDDPAKFMGDGTLDLTIDGTGRVTGSVDGPAGPALVIGQLVDGEIRGQVARKDPKDEGLFGTLTAKINGATADGTMSLASEGNAELVRDGKVTLKKK